MTDSNLHPIFKEILDYRWNMQGVSGSSSDEPESCPKEYDEDECDGCDLLTENIIEMNKAEQMLEKHINENDLNFIFHEKKDLWQELLNAMNEALCLALVGRSYSFVEPKFFVDDKVWFKDNKGFEMEGKIVAVETHWSKKNESYHIYSLYKEGRKRLMHVGERNIIYRYDF